MYLEASPGWDDDYERRIQDTLRNAILNGDFGDLGEAVHKAFHEYLADAFDNLSDFDKLRVFLDSIGFPSIRSFLFLAVKHPILSAQGVIMFMRTRTKLKFVPKGGD